MLILLQKINHSKSWPWILVDLIRFYNLWYNWWAFNTNTKHDEISSGNIQLGKYLNMQQSSELTSLTSKPPVFWWKLTIINSNQIQTNALFWTHLMSLIAGFTMSWSPFADKEIFYIRFNLNWSIWSISTACIYRL